MDFTAGQLDQETARAHRAVWQALDAWQAPPVSPDFDQRLYRRVRAEAHVSWWQRLWPLQPLAAAGCMLLIASLIFQRPAAPRPDTVRADQVERTLDDIELLHQFGAT